MYQVRTRIAAIADVALQDRVGLQVVLADDLVRVLVGPRLGVLPALDVEVAVDPVRDPIASELDDVAGS